LACISSHEGGRKGSAFPGNEGTSGPLKITVVGLAVDERPLVLDDDLRLDGDLNGEDALDEASLVIWVMPVLIMPAIEANSLITADISVALPERWAAQDFRKTVIDAEGAVGVSAQAAVVKVAVAS